MSTREQRWAEIDASVARVRPVFRTLTSEDWCREIQRARATPNAVSARIREKILAGDIMAPTAGAPGGCNIKNKEEASW